MNTNNILLTSIAFLAIGSIFLLYKAFTLKKG